MADAIPVSDPGLLAAQAKAGQAGVDAYNAALSTMQQQKQSAVQTALQEAALRGAPAGAAESQSGIISAPYDQRIASLTQNLAGFQAANAGREARMNDYNAATMAARSYIPQQTEQIVAPIRANADFQVRNTQMEGEMRVAGINADTELTLAKMRAAVQASQIAAAKKAAGDAAKAAKLPTLNQGQLGGLLDPMVAEMLTSSAGAVQDMLASNAQQRRSTGAAAAEGMRLSPADDAAARQASQTANQAKYAAAYGGRGLAQQKANDFARSASAAFQAQEQAQNPVIAQTGPSAVPPITTPAGSTAAEAKRYQEYIARLREQYGQMSASAANVTGQTVQQLANTPLDAVHVAAARAAAMSAAPSKATTAAQQGYQQLRTNLTDANKKTAEFGLQRLLRPMTAPLQEARDTRANTLIAGPGGNQVGLSTSQLAGLNPLQQAMVVSGLNSGALTSPEEFQWVLGNPAVGGGPNEASSDIVRAAYQQAAQQLQSQGLYDFGPEDLAASMPDKVPSIYDFLQGRSNLPSAEEQTAQFATEGRAQAAEADKAQTAQEKADEDEAAEGLAAKYGRYPSKDLGSRVQVLANLVDYDAQIQQAKPVFDQIVANWDTTRGALSAGQITTQLIQAGVSPAVVPYVLYSFGWG